MPSTTRAKVLAALMVNIGLDGFVVRSAVIRLSPMLVSRAVCPASRRLSTQTVAECYYRPPKANLDKSDLMRAFHTLCKRALQRSLDRGRSEVLTMRKSELPHFMRGSVTANLIGSTDARQLTGLHGFGHFEADCFESRLCRSGRRSLGGPGDLVTPCK